LPAFVGLEVLLMRVPTVKLEGNQYVILENEELK
jgi:hypothetical protein